MISIIIPTLNEEKTIETTLQALNKLNDCEYEIIISDGKSTDRTIEIAQKYNAKVIIYEGAIRQTISNARNLGASIASGEFFVFLDADVIIPDINNFFKKALSLFSNHQKLFGLSVFIKVLPESETLTDKIIFTLVNYINLFWNNFLKWGRAGGEFHMIRSSIFKKIKGYNEKISVTEDIDMFRRLAKEGKTRIERSLMIMHTGRRAHKIGWSKLLLSWSVNWIFVLIFKRSFNTVWKEIR